MASAIHNVLQAMDNLANAPTSLALRLTQAAPPPRVLQITADLTPPKVVKRKRRLTLPLDVTSTASSGRTRWFGKHEQLQRVYEQRQSPLLRLPAEIRARIWQYVILGNGDGEIALGWRGSGHGRGRASAFKVIPGEDREKSKLGVLGMLRSCRLIYSESIKLLYSVPVFAFHKQHVSTFLAFFGAILPHRREQIRYLDLEWFSTWNEDTGSPRPPPARYNARWSYTRIDNIKALSQLPDATVAPTRNDFVYPEWVIEEVLKSMKGLELGGVKRGRASTGCFAR